jgi:ubiquinone/menaquinone biosynthesis C-methylase UbiE
MLVLALAGCGDGRAPAAAPRRSALERARAAEALDRYRQPDLLIARLALREGDRVADVGAGRGYLTFRLARAVGPRGRVVATDVDAAALAALSAAAEKTTRTPPHAPIEVRRVAPDEPGLGDERFDLILLSEVDHLLPDRAAYLRRLAARLAPGGRIAVCNRRNFRGALDAAARAAGLRALGEATDLPAHFLVFFGAEQ